MTKSNKKFKNTKAYQSTPPLRSSARIAKRGWSLILHQLVIPLFILKLPSDKEGRFLLLSISSFVIKHKHSIHIIAKNFTRQIQRKFLIQSYQFVLSLESSIVVKVLRHLSTASAFWVVYGLYKNSSFRKWFFFREVQSIFSRD